MAVATPKKQAEQAARAFKVNPEINERLEAFMRSQSDLVKFVKELPREQLERKFLLRKMQDAEQQKDYTAKVSAWLQKPEQAQWVKDQQTTISQRMSPAKQEGELLNRAKVHISKQKIKLN